MFTRRFSRLIPVALPALFAAAMLGTLPAAASAADIAVSIPAPAPRAVQPAAAPRDTFHPDYSRALSAGQMTAAWQAEVRRLFPSQSVLNGNWGP